LRALGLSDAAIDPEGNVVARRKGAGGAPTLVLSAHLDTVFPRERRQGAAERRPLPRTGLRRRFARSRRLVDGTARNAGQRHQHVGRRAVRGHRRRGRAGKSARRQSPVARPQEHRRFHLGGFRQPAGRRARRSKIVSQATGSRRWSATFTTTGGHSFNNFGLPSAIHAMGRAIAKIDELRPPADPKTTFHRGCGIGGTSVNAIAGEAQMQVDIRSNSAAELARLEKQILAVIDQAVVEENARWNSKDTKVQTRLLGDRPAGIARNGTPVVQAALQAAVALKLRNR